MQGPTTVLALLSQGTIETDYGEFQISVFHDGTDQAVVLTKGIEDASTHLLCRIHSECISAHVFFGKECDCREQMIRSQTMISEDGAGIIIFLQQEGRGSGAAAHVATLDLKRKGVAQPEAYRMCGFQEDIRRYEIAAKVLKYYDIESIRLISSNVKKKSTIVNYGIDVVDTIDLTGTVVELGESIETIRGYQRLGIHEPINKAAQQKWVLVIGDLNVDYLIAPGPDDTGVFDRGPARTGGTGLNAAKAFKQAGIEPIVFGKVGRDRAADMLVHDLESASITSFLLRSNSKSTGCSTLLFLESERRRFMITDQVDNANDYDAVGLEKAMALGKIGRHDVAFVVAHAFARAQPDDVTELFRVIRRTKAQLVLDLVPHNLYDKIDFETLKVVLSDRARVLIAEFATLMRFLGVEEPPRQPSIEDWQLLCREFPADYLVVRYGVGNISQQVMCRCRTPGECELLEELATGYDSTPAEEKVGFGDRLTAKLLAQHWSEITESSA